MRAVIYTRVSSDQNQGRSVQDQEKECRAWCANNGHEVGAVHSDNDIGASRWSGKDRPGWAKVKRDLRAGDILVVWEASRGYRDLEEFVVIRNLCAELKVSLSYAGKVLDFTQADDRFLGGLDALLAEKESEQIRERVLRGQRGAVAAGRPHTRPPWGYKLVGRGVWEPDPIAAPRVKESVARLLAGETQYMVLKWLKESDPEAWAPANATNLQQTLVNPAYAGLRVHRGEVTGKGTWEALITEHQHLKLVNRMKRMKSIYGWAYRPGHQEKAKYLLSGIAICGKCEKPVRHTRGGQKGHFYQCFDGHVMRRAEPIDKEVLKKLFERLSEVNPADYDTEDPRVAAAAKEIEDIEEELEDWLAAAGRREVTRAAFARVERDLRNRVAALQPLTAERQSSSADYAKLKGRWPSLTIQHKRDIIRSFFRVTLTPSDPGRRNGGLRVERI